MAIDFDNVMGHRFADPDPLCHIHNHRSHPVAILKWQEWPRRIDLCNNRDGKTMFSGPAGSCPGIPR